MPFTQALGSAGPALMAELEAPYKDLHQHPALSVQEVRTAKVVADAIPPPRGYAFRRRCRIERMSVHEVALAGLNDHRLFKRSSIWRAFAFAIGGAVAAKHLNASRGAARAHLENR